jgi:hypothetical protein
MLLPRRVNHTSVQGCGSESCFALGGINPLTLMPGRSTCSFLDRNSFSDFQMRKMLAAAYR